jgi:hypothetical protein
VRLAREAVAGQNPRASYIEGIVVITLVMGATSSLDCAAPSTSSLGAPLKPNHPRAVVDLASEAHPMAGHACRS